MLSTACNAPQRGVTVVQAKPDDPDLGESIEKKVSDKVELDASVYTKVGSFVGGLIGGATQAVRLTLA